MTFKQCQDRVLERTRLSTTVARNRVKNRINERLRAVQSSVGLAKTRIGTVSLNTVSGTVTMATTGVLKVGTVTIPLQNRVLEERTMIYMRLLDPSNSASGLPQEYAVEKIGAVTSTLHFYPKPDAIYAVQIDGLLVGTDLTVDADVPGIPEDFHDILIDGVLADEYGDMTEQQAAANKSEAAYTLRLRELRYFLAKSVWLSRRQGGDSDYPSWLLNLGRWIA